MFCFHQFLKEGSCRQLWGAKTDVCSHGRELKQPSYWQRSKANIGSGLTFSQRISPMIDWLCTVALLILIDLISLVLVMIRSFQLMKRIETSCLLNRLAARIGRMKTWGGLEIQALKTFIISVIVRSLSRECDCWLNHCYRDNLEKTKIEKTQKTFGKSFTIFDFCYLHLCDNSKIKE